MSIKRMDVIQHRANGLDIIRQASTDGAHGVEVDVFQTTDGVLVLRHSHRWDGRDVPAQEYDPAMGPTLEQAIEVANDLGLDVYAEIKLPEKHWEHGSLDIEEAVLDEMAAVAACYSILSFSMECLCRVHEIAPDVPIIANAREGNRLPDIAESMNDYVNGVCAPACDLPWHAAAHSFPLFLYNVRLGDVPESARSGLAGLIVDDVKVWL